MGGDTDEGGLGDTTFVEGGFDIFPCETDIAGLGTGTPN